MSHENGPGTLHENVDHLLMHRTGRDPLRPDFVVTRHPLGGYGVALVLDGYYSTRELAESVVPTWRDSLGLVLADLAATDPAGVSL